MTTAIRTACTDIALADTIGNLYYEYLSENYRDDILDAIRDYVIAYVHHKMPESLTWFPYTSEVYVEIDGDEDGYLPDDVEVDDYINDTQGEAFEALDEAWDDDHAAFLRKIQDMTDAIRGIAHD